MKTAQHFRGHPKDAFYRSTRGCCDNCSRGPFRAHGNKRKSRAQAEPYRLTAFGPFEKGIQMRTRSHQAGRNRDYLYATAEQFGAHALAETGAREFGAAVWHQMRNADLGSHGSDVYNSPLP